jgi:hypothetical protein
MLDFKTILIFEETNYAALDLSQAIEESDGCVAGPVTTLSETLTILDSSDVGGAIVDCELADAAEVVMLLAQRDVPLVVQICASLPQSLGHLAEKASVLVRPVDPRTILESLLMEIGTSELRASNKLGSDLKEV